MLSPLFLPAKPTYHGGGSYGLLVSGDDPISPQQNCTRISMTPPEAPYSHPTMTAPEKGGTRTERVQVPKSDGIRPQKPL